MRTVLCWNGIGRKLKFLVYQYTIKNDEYQLNFLSGLASRDQFNINESQAFRPRLWGARKVSGQWATEDIRNNLRWGGLDGSSFYRTDYGSIARETIVQILTTVKVSIV